MGSFGSSPLLLKLTFLFTLVGFLLVTHAHTKTGGQGPVRLSPNYRTSEYHTIRAFSTIGYVCFLTAAFLASCVVYLDELNGNTPALIALLTIEFIAGVSLIIAMAVWNSMYFGCTNLFLMLSGSGSVLGLAAGICLSVEVCCGGGGGGGGKRNTGKVGSRT